MWLSSHGLDTHAMFHFIILCYVVQVIAASDQCGIRNFDPGTVQFAVNGEGNSDVKAPWIVAIGKFGNGSDGETRFAVTCSGVILTPRIIITANHCFSGGIRPEYIRAGVTRIDQANPQDRRIREHRTHPDHNNKDWYYDLALVFLTEELNFNARVSDLCLPSEPSPHPGDGVGVLVQGWGEDFLGDSGMKVTETKVNMRSKARHPFIKQYIINTFHSSKQLLSLLK